MDSQILFNVETEQALLGSILIDTNCIWEVRMLCGIEDFYKSEHRIIYRIMCDLVDRNLEIDLITIQHEAENQDIDFGYIIGLVNVVPTSINAVTYAELVADLGLKRRLESAGRTVINLSHNADISGKEALKIGMDTMVATTPKKQQENGDIKFAGLKALDTIEKRSSGEEELVTTGFDKLDKILEGGLERTNLIYVGARPGMGKTSLFCPMSIKLARLGYAVTNMNFEMRPDQLFTRMMSYESGIPYTDLKQGHLSEIVYRVSGELCELPIYLPNAMPDIKSLATQCRVIKSTRGLDILFLDYFQLLEYHGFRGNSYERYTAISKTLKQIALDLDVVLFCASQLTRASTHRPDGRPTKEDLKETGGLEQDADVVLLIHGKEDDFGQRTVKREIIVDKQRNGRKGIVNLAYTLETMRFDNAEGYNFGAFLG